MVYLTLSRQSYFCLIKAGGGGRGRVLKTPCTILPLELRQWGVIHLPSPTLQVQKLCRKNF